MNIILPGRISMDEEIVIYATKYLGKLAKLVQETDKRVLSNYILMRFIRHRINNLDKRWAGTKISPHSRLNLSIIIANFFYSNSF